VTSLKSITFPRSIGRSDFDISFFLYAIGIRGREGAKRNEATGEWF
jgi:hypothetical protein